MMLLTFLHDGHGTADGFMSGVLHPLTGPDHLAAMVAVGLWGAFLGAPALWLLPIVFPLVMAGGAMLGLAEVAIPAVETGIALSAVALGLMVALAAKPPLPVAALLVGVFAIFHGHAHGTELPESADALSYSLGFVLSTGALHLAGVGLGFAVEKPRGRAFVRGCGAAIALAGLGFLTGVL